MFYLGVKGKMNMPDKLLNLPKCKQNTAFCVVFFFPTQMLAC